MPPDEPAKDGDDAGDEEPKVRAVWGTRRWQVLETERVDTLARRTHDFGDPRVHARKSLRARLTRVRAIANVPTGGHADSIAEELQPPASGLAVST